MIARIHQPTKMRAKIGVEGGDIAPPRGRFEIVGLHMTFVIAQPVMARIAELLQRHAFIRDRLLKVGD